MVLFTIDEASTVRGHMQLTALFAAHVVNYNLNTLSRVRKVKRKAFHSGVHIGDSIGASEETSSRPIHIVRFLTVGPCFHNQHLDAALWQ